MSFTGPLFIIGMPRSGTKLLRDLLNENPKVGIPTIESHFIPDVINRFESPKKIKKSKYSFLKYFGKSSFQRNMKLNNIILTETDIDSFPIHNWTVFFKSLFEKFIGKENYTVWGDKTPSYLTCIRQLNNAFDNAKFIHIIRDPRDYSLSCRTIWGKNIYRSSARWKTEIMEARKQAQELDKDTYLEVRYEDLLSNSQSVLKKVSKFIGVNFSEEMLTLSNPLEEVESTKNKNHIVSSNHSKFLKVLSKNEIRKIESLTVPTIQEVGYETLEKHKNVARLSYFELKIYMISDLFQALKYYWRQKGFIGGTFYYLKLGTESLNNRSKTL